MSKRKQKSGTMGNSDKSVQDVEIVDPSYQPSKAELEVDVRVDATFEEAIQALAGPVSIRYVSHPKTNKRN